MDWKLEVVTIPVADVEAAARFYHEQVGFAKDLDVEIGENARLIQLTPAGSGCSIHLNPCLGEMVPGPLQGLILVVGDIEAARDELVARGVEATPVRHMEGGEWVDGRGGEWNSFVFFSDPDGNSWTVQERPQRAE